MPRSWWLMLTVKVANRLRATRSAEPGSAPALTCKRLLPRGGADLRHRRRAPYQTKQGHVEGVARCLLASSMKQGGPCGWLTCHVIKLFTRPLVHCVERWCSFGGRIENRETHTSNYSFLLLQSSQRDARPVPTNRRVHTHTVCVCVCLTHTHTHTHTHHATVCNAVSRSQVRSAPGTASVYEMPARARTLGLHRSHTCAHLFLDPPGHVPPRCDKFSYRIVEFIFPQHQRISEVHSSKSRPRGARHTSPYDRVGHS